MPKRPSDIGTRIATTRALVALSARELDRLAGISEGHTSLIESVVDDVKASTLAKLGHALGVSLDWLITGQGKAPTERTVRVAVDAARVEYAKTAA